MKEWILTYGGKDYDISDDEKQLLTERKPDASMPAGWFEVKLLDGRSLCVLLSTGASVALEEKKVTVSAYEEADVMFV